MTRDEAAGLHARLLWLLDASGMKRGQLAHAIGRNAGTVSPWFAKEDWSLPDARGLIGVLRVVRLDGVPVNANWLLLGTGTPTAVADTPGPLFYRGALLVIGEVEQALAQLKERHAAEQVTTAAAGEVAARVAETERAVKKAAGKRRGRRAG